jgi:hypothetical protein
MVGKGLGCRNDIHRRISAIIRQKSETGKKGEPTINRGRLFAEAKGEHETNEKILDFFVCFVFSCSLRYRRPRLIVELPLFG